MEKGGRIKNLISWKKKLHVWYKYDKANTFQNIARNLSQTYFWVNVLTIIKVGMLNLLVVIIKLWPLIYNKKYIFLKLQLFKHVLCCLNHRKVIFAEDIRSSDKSNMADLKKLKSKTNQINQILDLDNHI